MKGKIHPGTGREIPYAEYMYSSTLPLISAKNGCRCSTPRSGRITLTNDTAFIVTVAGWASGPVRKGAESLVPISIRSKDLPARIHSLYQLRYPSYFTLRYPTLSPLFTHVNNNKLGVEKH
jgi:hypothetical protein